MEDTPAETTETLLAEASARLCLLEKSRPEKLDGFGLSSRSKLPFKVLCYRECLLWRIVQLGQAACANFANNHLISGLLLTRAAVETSAALWHAQAKLKRAIESKGLGNLADDFRQLSMGTKTDTDILPSAVNVLTFVDSVA